MIRAEPAPPVQRAPEPSLLEQARPWLERLQLWPPSGGGSKEVQLGAWWATRLCARRVPSFLLARRWRNAVGARGVVSKRERHRGAGAGLAHGVARVSDLAGSFLRVRGGLARGRGMAPLVAAIGRCGGRGLPPEGTRCADPRGHQVDQPRVDGPRSHRAGWSDGGDESPPAFSRDRGRFGYLGDGGALLLAKGNGGPSLGGGESRRIGSRADVGWFSRVGYGVGARLRHFARRRGAPLDRTRGEWRRGRHGAAAVVSAYARGVVAPWGIAGAALLADAGALWKRSEPWLAAAAVLLGAHVALWSRLGGVGFRVESMCSNALLELARRRWRRGGWIVTRRVSAEKLPRGGRVRSRSSRSGRA